MGNRKPQETAPKTPSAHDPLSAPEAFEAALKLWFEEVAEDYPWRRTRAPYEILVSEIMLQQTQVATVLGRRYFENWLALFPDVHALAAAHEDEVLKAWEGLGYYRRARNLQAAAKAVVERHDGNFPTDPATILSLPGVGRYTAGAVATFALGLAEPIVDANIARVLARLFNFRDRIDTTAGTKQLWAWAEALVPTHNPRAYNSAIMELGQKICRPKNPACQGCPVRDFCRCENPADLPQKKKPRETIRVEEHVIYAVRESDGAVLLEQESGSRRQRMWKLPEAEGSETTLPIVSTSTYGITHHRVTLITHAADQAIPSERRRWVAADEMDVLTIAPAYRRVIESLLDAPPLL